MIRLKDDLNIAAFDQGRNDPEATENWCSLTARTIIKLTNNYKTTTRNQILWKNEASKRIDSLLETSFRKKHNPTDSLI